MTATADAPPAEAGNRHVVGRLRGGEPLVLAMLLGLAVGAVLLGVSGANPITAYQDMASGTLGSRSDLSLVFVEVAPLCIIGLGLSVAYRAKVWNIGAEGQLVFGALIGGWFALEVPIDVKAVLIPLTFVAGAIAGGVWAMIAGWLKAQWRVNEVISSLLLNYAAIFTLNYAVRKPLRAPGGFQPVSAPVPDAARLPDVPGLSVHIGFVVAVALVPIVWYVLARTPFGFRVQMMGHNSEATEAAGVDPRRLTLAVMAWSGACAGMAGVVQVLGPETRLTNNLAAGLGFTAIIVALLGRLRAVGVFLAALFIGVLTLGGDVIQRTQEVPRTMTIVLQAVFVLCLLVADRLWKRRGA